MLIVFLSVNGAILINWLPLEEKVDCGYFCEKILKPLSEIVHNRRPVHSARVILHFDNATLHRPAVTGNCFESCQSRQAPQPPYSPDSSPCDFFLFDDLKTKLKGEEFETMEEPQAQVEELLSQGTSDTDDEYMSTGLRD
jgi:histone-lysine N-methyltransferase SETMAR